MSLKYTLVPSRFKGAEPEDYLARTVDVKSHDLDSIMEQLLQMKTTVSEADYRAALTNIFELFGILTARGEVLNLDIFKTSLSISGVFEGATGNFDKSKHHIRVNVTAGKVLKEALGKVHVERIDTDEHIPHILEVKDSVSGSVNDHITSNGVLDIAGSLLKIQGDSPQNGVALIGSDGTAHKVETLIENKPSRLFVMLPQLDKGEYTLQVTTQYNGGTEPLKTPRLGVFHTALTVV